MESIIKQNNWHKCENLSQQKQREMTWMTAIYIKNEMYQRMLRSQWKKLWCIPIFRIWISETMAGWSFVSKTEWTKTNQKKVQKILKWKPQFRITFMNLHKRYNSQFWMQIEVYSHLLYNNFTCSAFWWNMTDRANTEDLSSKPAANSFQTWK